MQERTKKGYRKEKKKNVNGNNEVPRSE